MADVQLAAETAADISGLDHVDPAFGDIQGHGHLFPETETVLHGGMHRQPAVGFTVHHANPGFHVTGMHALGLVHAFKNMIRFGKPGFQVAEHERWVLGNIAGRGIMQLRRAVLHRRFRIEHGG